MTSRVTAEQLRIGLTVMNPKRPRVGSARQVLDWIALVETAMRQEGL